MHGVPSPFEPGLEGPLPRPFQTGGPRGPRHWPGLTQVSCLCAYLWSVGAVEGLDPTPSALSTPHPQHPQQLLFQSGRLWEGRQPRHSWSAHSRDLQQARGTCQARVLHASCGSSARAALTRTLAGVSFSQQTCRNEAQPSAGPLKTS